MVGGEYPIHFYVGFLVHMNVTSDVILYNLVGICPQDVSCVE